MNLVPTNSPRIFEFETSKGFTGVLKLSLPIAIYLLLAVADSFTINLHSPPE